MDHQTHLLAIKLMEFFKKEEHIKQIKDIVEQKSEVTLTLCDWFVTSYARYRCVEFEHPESKATINVWQAYCAQLKEHTKRYSDPFNRNEKFEFEYNDKNEKIVTSVRQLCFFRWAITSGVLQYIVKNVTFLRQQHRLSKSKALSPDSESGYKVLSIQRGKFEISFD